MQITRNTQVASVTVTAIAGDFVLSAFLLADSGKPDTDLGELAFETFYSVSTARAAFDALVSKLETAEALGLLQNELAMRKLSDYARRDALGLIP